MKKLKAMVLGACALMFTSVVTTPLIAGSGDFAGPYIGIKASLNGLELDGKYTDNSSEVTNGTAGAIAGGAAAELGYNLPLGESFLLGVGIQYNPEQLKLNGDAGEGDSDSDSGDVTINLEDHWSIFIQPTVSFTDSSAVYLKYGFSHIDASFSGDIHMPPGSITGDIVGIGTRTMFANGMFLQMEGGMEIYSQLDLAGGGNKLPSKGPNKTSLKADPTVAYASMTLGYRF